MTDDELFDLIRARIADPKRRIDVAPNRRPPLYAPATTAALANAERDLGLALPPLLRALYSKIANGGFGPGYGMLGIEEGYTLNGKTIVVLYHEFRSYGEPYTWPEGLLPLWEWGCAVWSCLDARSPAGTIVTHDDVDGATETVFTLRSWLGAWARGTDMWKEIYQDKDATIINPFTKKPVSTKVRDIVIMNSVPAEAVTVVP
jgi:SMI1 / KNR4 family (SUKH-1)